MRICVILVYIFTHTVIGQEDGEEWNLLQFEGLDTVFIGARKSELNLVTAQDVCRGLQSTDLSTLRANDFRSNIKGQNVDVDAVPIATDGYQLFKLNEHDISLYHCDHPDHSQKYFLTHAFDFDKSFFLFVYNYETRDMMLQALIEEDVAPLSEDPDEDIKDLEKSHLEKKKSYVTYFYSKYENDADISSVDPVCLMGIEQKIRLCSLLLNTVYYKNLYTFYPSPANVDPVCGSTRLAIGNNLYRELMYRCHVTVKNNDEQRTAIYISRSYRNYEAIVSKPTKNSSEAKDVPVVEMDNVVQNIPFIEKSEYVEDAILGPEKRLMIMPQPYSTLGIKILVRNLLAE